jgi:hypothetical protein
VEENKSMTAISEQIRSMETRLAERQAPQATTLNLHMNDLKEVAKEQWTKHKGN